MHSLCSTSSCSVPSKRAFQSSSRFFSFSPRNPTSLHSTFLRILRASSTSTGESKSKRDKEPIRTSYAGVKLVEDVTRGKLRLDSWITSRIEGISRARVQSSIKSGLVAVNGRVVDKVSHNLRAGDKVNCVISDLQPLSAEPEDIQLNVVYEDQHILVVNKAAHMVVHPAPGNPSGTLVNSLLHHCSLPIAAFPEEEFLSDTEDGSDDEAFYPSSSEAHIRPGIVHRLDEGTSGLLVVAKFKLHTINRVYISLTSGVPVPSAGRVDVPVGRDPNNWIRMIARPGLGNHGQARNTASRYRVIETLAGGSSALVEWRLETGRTHQYIRAHAKYLGIPLLGDEVYGGTKSMALSSLQSRTPPSFQCQLSELITALERPCLHALSLGFQHPCTGEMVHFSCPPPSDFAEMLKQLRTVRT